MSDELVVTCAACRALAPLEPELPAHPGPEQVAPTVLDPFADGLLRGPSAPAVAARVRLEPFTRRHAGHVVAVRARGALGPGEWRVEALRTPDPIPTPPASPAGVHLGRGQSISAELRAALAASTSVDQLIAALGGGSVDGALAVAAMVLERSALERLAPAILARALELHGTQAELAARAHAAITARLHADAGEVARAVRELAARIATAELVAGRDPRAQLEQLGERGAPARRAAADAAVAAIHEAVRKSGQLVPSIGRAIDVGLREALGDDLPGWRALGEDLAERACRATDAPGTRASAFEPLVRGWPGRHVALRREGRLPAQGIPTWQEWDRVRMSSGAVVAAGVDPDALLAFLEDRRNAPAAATLVPPGMASFALEAAAGVAVHVARLEPARAARVEQVLRARALEVPIDEQRRSSSIELFRAHVEVLELLGPVDALEHALAVVEHRLDHGAWSEHALHGALREAHRRGAAALVIAGSCLRRIRERSRPAALRWKARLALDSLRQVAGHAPVVDPAPWLTAADDLLVAALTDPTEDEALRLKLRDELDRVLPPERALALRREGVLPRGEVAPWYEVPGALSGNGNAIEAAGEDLARKALPEELARLLEAARPATAPGALPARLVRTDDAGREEAAELGRVITVFDVAGRIAKRRASDGALLEPGLRRFLDDPRDLAVRPPGGGRGPDHVHHLRLAALRGWWKLVDALPQVPPAERAPWTEALRDAFERVLAAPPAPVWSSDVGQYPGAAVARGARKLLAQDAVTTFGPWLLARVADRARGAPERMQARRAIDGLGDPATQKAGDALLLRALGDPQEDADLRREAHPFVAERLPKEVAALIEQGLLDLGPPPSIADLQVPIQGGYMLHEANVTAAAGRSHPARLVASLPRIDELERLLGALVVLPRVLQRAPEVGDAAEAALLALVADPRSLEVKKEGSRELFFVRALAIAAHRAVVERRPAADRPRGLVLGLRAALRADDVARALYAIHADAWGPSKARDGAGIPPWRLYVIALVEAGAPDAVLEVARGAAATSPPGERLAALDALYLLVLRARPEHRARFEVERDAALSQLRAQGFVATDGLEGLHLLQDWAATHPPQPRFAWVGPG